MRQLSALEIPSVVSSNYTILPDDYMIRFDSSGGVIDLQLPDPAERRELLFVDVAGTSSQGANLVAFATELVAGCVGQKFLTVNFGPQMAYKLSSDGTDYWAEGITF